MRWISQADTALDRALNRYSHGSLLAEKQGIQWLIADSAMELYQCKLMVLHAASKIDKGEDFRTEVSMSKHFVANSLNRIVDRAIQVHGALGYSTDTPLAKMLQHARWPASRTGPTRFTRCASPSIRSRRTRARARPTPPPEGCRFEHESFEHGNFEHESFESFEHGTGWDGP